MKMCCNHIGIKQLNTQLLEYIEVPGEAIWWHRMQEKLSAAGSPPPDPAGGAYSARSIPDPLAGWGAVAAPSPTTTAVGPLDLASPVPHSKIVPPLDSGWRRP